MADGCLRRPTRLMALSAGAVCVDLTLELRLPRRLQAAPKARAAEIKLRALDLTSLHLCMSMCMGMCMGVGAGVECGVWSVCVSVRECLHACG